VHVRENVVRRVEVLKKWSGVNNNDCFFFFFALFLGLGWNQVGATQPNPQLSNWVGKL